MAYNHRVAVHYSVTEPPSIRANQKLTPQYSELLQTTGVDSDCGSGTYAVPAYASSDGSHGTYSTTTAIYHQPNCQCHMVTSQPQTCVSPTHHSVQTCSSNTTSSSHSHPMNASSCTKKMWTGTEQDRRNTKVDRTDQPITWVWISLTIVIFISNTVSLTQSTWLVNSTTTESLGVVKQCFRESSSREIQCGYYKGLSSLQLPSVSWKLTLVFFCVADTFLGLSCLLACGTSLIATAKLRNKISFFTGYIQLFSAILFSTAILFYMVGLDAEEVKSICQDSSVFDTGSCDIGWSYLLIMVSSSICYLLPVFSHYTDYTLRSRDKKESPECIA